MAVVLMGIWMGHFRKGFAWTENPNLEFNWHPLLMTLGLIYLYGNGKYKKNSLLTPETVVWFHKFYN